MTAVDEQDTRRWAVTYREGRRAEVWAVIEGVPSDVKLPELRAAIESWQRWPDWQRRMSSSGRFSIIAEHRWQPMVSGLLAANEDRGMAGGAVMMSWAELAPTERHVSVRVDSALWGRLRAAAAAEGVALSEWCRSAYLEKLGAS